MVAVARRAGRWVARAALLASVALALLVAVGPRTGAYRTLTVLSASMEPTFGPGSVVVVRPVPVSELAVGDVITYDVPVEDGRVVTHRVIRIDRGAAVPTVRTKGDANAAPDPWAIELTGDVVWRTETSIPWLGYVIGALREPAVSRILVVAGPVLLGLLLVAQVWRRPVPSIAALEWPADPPSPDLRTRVRAAPALDTVVMAARVTRRVGHWTDDVLSGRRWLRSSAGHA